MIPHLGDVHRARCVHRRMSIEIPVTISVCTVRRREHPECRGNVVRLECRELSEQFANATWLVVDIVGFDPLDVAASAEQISEREEREHMSLRHHVALISTVVSLAFSELTQSARSSA